ncbi:MAG: histidinol-phosphate transaminase [Clostridia bacterium]|nr:histidinol-phosphate transaminase [Clostridia bacterium]
MRELKCRKEILDIKPYVPGKPIEEAERELGIKGIIKLASNENPLGPSPKALKALKENLHKIFMYPDGSCYYLKRDLAEKLGIEEENILIGNGADETIKLAAEAYLNPGEEVIIPSPSFSEYEFAAKLMGGKCVFSPLKDFRLDLDDMAEKINDKTKIIYLCNPNNPTGTIFHRDELETFLNKVHPGVLVIVDEAYYEYVVHESYPQTLDFISQYPNLLILRTFSKIYGLAGVRVGYALGSGDLIDDINRVREPFNVNMLAQAAAKAALKDKDHVIKSKEINEEGKKFLYRQLDEIGLAYWPTEANFIWVDLKRNCRDVFEKMMSKGVIIRTGDIFGHDSFIRITIGDQEQNEKLVRVLKEVL